MPKKGAKPDTSTTNGFLSADPANHGSFTNQLNDIGSKLKEIKEMCGEAEAQLVLKHLQQYADFSANEAAKRLANNT